MEVEITLKKALDIQKAVLEAANRIKVNRSIRLSAYGTVDVEKTVSEAREKLQDAILDTLELLNVHYNIKALAGEQNDAAGITGLMRERAKLEAIEKKLGSIMKHLDGEGSDIYSRLDAAMDSSDISAIKERIAVTKERIQSKDRVGEETFSVILTTEEFIDGNHAEVLRIRRHKATIVDQIAALNINHKIKINDADAAVLRKHKIL